MKGHYSRGQYLNSPGVLPLLVQRRRGDKEGMITKTIPLRAKLRIDMNQIIKTHKPQIIQVLKRTHWFLAHEA
jgi:hypothetical protein